MVRKGSIVDLDQITVVRTSVRENHMSVEQMAARGITQASIAEQMLAGELGCWVLEANGIVVAFSMAVRKTGDIFALFVLPGHEGKGYGSALLLECEKWLKDSGHSEAHLDTDAGTRAFRFYQRKGFVVSKTLETPLGDQVLYKRLL
jgi:GNAT superfamily N-acetyltransferase